MIKIISMCASNILAISVRYKTVYLSSIFSNVELSNQINAYNISSRKLQVSEGGKGHAPHNNLDVNLNDVLIVVVEPLRLKPLFYLITDCGDLLSCRVEGALPLTSVKLRL